MAVKLLFILLFFGLVRFVDDNVVCFPGIRRYRFDRSEGGARIHSSNRFVCRIPDQQGVCGYGFCYHGPGPDESISPDVVTTHDGRICPDRGSFTDMRPGVLAFPVDGTTRVGYVREHAGRGLKRHRRHR